MPFEDVPAAKRTMRRRILDARKTLDAERVQADADRIAERALAVPELAAAETIATYYSIDHEPGTRPLVAALLESGRRLLLPVVLPDMDLDWAELTDVDELTTARMGLREPSGSRLGTDAIADVDAVLCPGLAVDVTGVRLGRGAGCYDRALGRVDPSTLRCVVLYDHEVVESLPATRDDERVDLVITPTRTLRLAQPGLRPRSARTA